ncbi:hypothetical protein HN51_022152 [Arachis hypogaea]|uniref:Protein RETARDED ROOT GROWTH-LIKE n=1 Tax=Arachis duranensis TaxID=130453 RepID=A0A6P4CD70_ARADU|nr:protein RETARDED ROOT GROWTH-LIKE [Arachis duranensis]XP_025649367.1 uncharacterized protein LOC112744088 [Arachis hypogaea]XP_057740136.1 protein RETARDED ROOT GROWTH-LIKE [Arachis stenosperma]QHO53312.1 Sporulation protein [Arachis hypogaea]
MFRTVNCSYFTLRTTLRLRTFLSSTSCSSSAANTPWSSSSSSSSLYPTLLMTSLISLPHSYSHSFLPSLPGTAITPTHASFSQSVPSKTRDIGSNVGLSVMRCISSSSSPSLPTLDWNDAVLCSEVGDGRDGSVEKDSKTSIPVRAFFFSTSVDLKSLVERNKPNFVTPSSRMTNYVVLKFDNHSKSGGLGTSFSRGSSSCYMVVFQYGSIVLFNVPEHEVDGYLKIVQKHASGLLPEMRKDEYEVREKPALSTWMQGGLDYIMLQYLNIDGIRTIGSVLGQSIALDYYGRQVDGMVAEFTDINREMEATGKFQMQRKKLFQLVGKANSNLADVILKLGLFERSDIAWKDAKYAQIWEYLRDEFELTQRFASLDFKLKFVEHNIRFLQEILQNRKSDFLEWLIIALIGAEILLSLYDIVHRSPVNL